jgi:hypothetical protein
MIKDQQVALVFFWVLACLTCARSSTKAENQSVAVTTIELYWSRTLFKEFKIPLASSPLILWCASVGTLTLESNSVFHVRTKHIGIDNYFIREKVVNYRDICFKFISSAYMRLTSLPKVSPLFEFFSSKTSLWYVLLASHAFDYIYS